MCTCPSSTAVLSVAWLPGTTSDTCRQATRRHFPQRSGIPLIHTYPLNVPHSPSHFPLTPPHSPSHPSHSPLSMYLILPHTPHTPHSPSHPSHSPSQCTSFSLTPLTLLMLPSPLRAAKHPLHVKAVLHMRDKVTITDAVSPTSTARLTHRATMAVQDMCVHQEPTGLVWGTLIHYRCSRYTYGIGCV